MTAKAGDEESGYSRTVNFFGHAVIACWQRPEPDFVLGSMLPDFVSMLRTRLPTVNEPAVVDGISFHHATDRIFHDLTSFRGLSSTAFAWLSEHGLRRGSARAVAHIGVEVLLDAALADDEAACAGYVSALDVATGERFQRDVKWPEAALSERFAKLCGALQARGIVRSDVAPEFVALRVRRALAGRPRLELDDAGEAVVAKWVLGARRAIVACAPDLIAELKAKLVPESIATLS